MEPRLRYGTCTQELVLDVYLARSIEPAILMQVEPLPPQTPHLSNRRLEPMTRSQPAFTHWP